MVNIPETNSSTFCRNRNQNPNNEEIVQERKKAIPEKSGYFGLRKPGIRVAKVCGNKFTVKTPKNWEFCSKNTLFNADKAKERGRAFRIMRLG